VRTKGRAVGLFKKWRGRAFFVTVAALVVTLCGRSFVSAYPVSVSDAAGVKCDFEKAPTRVVSLVPSVTEMIFKIGAGDAVKGVSYHDTYPAEVNTRKIVGGFFSPSIEIIEAIGPDVIFYADFHDAVKERFGGGNCRLIQVQTHSIADSYKNILLLGSIFGREKEARDLVAGIREELETIAGKVARIPPERRKRVIRIMGSDVVMTPGDDSFQNEMIQAAGGIPPRLGRNGDIVAITKEEWIRLNPQVIYGCGDDREIARKLLNRPGWRDVDAVRNGSLFFFPCDLTCRAAARTGYFVSWLSALLYTDEFSKREGRVLEEKTIGKRALGVDVAYVKDAYVLSSTIHDFANKTLVIDFTEPLTVVSTLEGERTGIESVGNHYSPPPGWVIEHKNGVEKIRERLCGFIGKTTDSASFLFTGADIDNLAIEHERFKDMEVYALVTAGVASNAIRISKNEGRFYEPGTINVILLSNMKLTNRAMTGAVSCATEAKTAALMDLDVRSSETPRLHQATGTGTDNIIVVQGTGVQIDNAGGHTKMGELIGRAVYQGVQKAIFRQNGLVNHRNVFQRLKERHISAYGLIFGGSCGCLKGKDRLVAALEEILLNPRYAALVEASFAMSDACERGLIMDLSGFDAWCRETAEDIAGMKISTMKDLIEEASMPIPLNMSLNALLNGIYFHKR
jgi:iron complex transport system substrate-binding protein